MLTADADQRAFWQGEGNPWWYFLNVFYENGKSLIGAGAIGGTVGTAFESFIGRWASIIPFQSRWPRFRFCSSAARRRDV